MYPQLQLLLEMIPKSQIDILLARLPPHAAAVLTGQAEADEDALAEIAEAVEAYLAAC